MNICFPVFIGVLFLAGLSGGAEASPQKTGAGRELQRLADDFVAARLERDPDLAYLFGLPLSEPLQSRLLDRSKAGRTRFYRTIDRLRRKLSRLDQGQLNHDDRVLHAVLSEELDSFAAIKPCNRELWDVRHIGGWLSDIIGLAQIQPAGTPELRAASLRRWGSLPSSVDVQIDNLNEGIALGYVAPRAVVERAIAQLDALIDSDATGSPFYSPAARDTEPEFASQTRALVMGPIRAALVKYRAYLNATYLPRSTASLSIADLPHGRACYQGLVRRYTSLAVSPEAFFQRAESANSEGLKEALEAGAERYKTPDLRALLQKARSDPEERYASAEQMLEDSRAVAAQAFQAFRPLFVTMPRQKLSVEPYPAAQRGLGLPPRYISSGNPSVPAVTWVPDDRFAAMPRGLMRSTMLHEGIPGHHLIGASRAEKPQHPLLKIAYQAAFDEGWAVYSEGLAGEAGMHHSPAARVINGINRSKGALLDVGIHSLRWDRPAIERYFASRGGLGQQGEDRILRASAFPGQQLSYTAGELTILELRAEAKRRLGSKFDLPAFHAAVLRDGGVPLWFLRESVERWIVEQGG